MVGSAVAGHRKFLHVCGEMGAWGKIIPTQVLPDLQGRGLVCKEAFLLTAFLVTFVATKVTRPSRGHAIAVNLRNFEKFFLRCSHDGASPLGKTT
jgi:hypothetical protein